MAEIETKTVEAMIVLSLSFTGPYDQTGSKLDELIAWVLRAGHPYSGPPIGIYYDDPNKVSPDQLRAEVVVPVEEQCKEGDGITRKELPGCLVASAVHQGPYAKVGPVYGEIFSWIAENGYRYLDEMGTREVFLKVSGEVDGPKQFMTEIQVPIEKA